MIGGKGKRQTEVQDKEVVIDGLTLEYWIVKLAEKVASSRGNKTIDKITTRKLNADFKQFVSITYY